MNNLRILADYLEQNVAPEKFDLLSFRYKANGLYRHKVSDNDLLSDCGTTACAVGWACVIPELQAQGLSWHDEQMTVYLHGENAIRPGLPLIAEFFGIESKQADWLFYAGHYPSGFRRISDVVRRMRRLLDGGQVADFID